MPSRAASEPGRALGPPYSSHRPSARGKFIFVGEQKFYVRGVTYGPFRPDGYCLGEFISQYRKPEVVECDFEQMRENGLNSVRTYTVPPRWLLDTAERHGLRVMIGLPWEQHTTFLDDRERMRLIEERVRKAVGACAGHPAILCYAIGNEIPASIVRWHGGARVERYLERLYRAVKDEDPAGLVTYVNYPSTEYLEVPFVDFVCFNVYLESQESFGAYLARLQNLAGNRPLVMTEIGLDSQGHGEEAQANMLSSQIRATFAAGCAGVFVFAWSDEWHRGGHDIADWDFGLIRRDGRAKSALAAVRNAFAEGPFPPHLPWPRISVVACLHNEERTVRECLESLLKQDYPHYELIVVDDGSTDSTAAIVQQYNVRLIRTENRGLSNARNLGLKSATGEIVAYIDGDASPDRHWLRYLAASFLNGQHSGIGGPNIAPPGDGLIADCVAKAPGGPVHVLLSDQEAEHIPGCNMAFRKVALEEMGGFDPQFRIAGDDVDLCWRLQEAGHTLGFSPAAVVWHHCRNSLSKYWRQQSNYGRAEALLERKWPAKYNALGHPTWAGRLYGGSHLRPLPFRRRAVRHGVWGSGLFQSVYEPAPNGFHSLLLTPEWYLVILCFLLLSTLGVLWRPMLAALLPLSLAIGAALTLAAANAAHARRGGRLHRRTSRLLLLSITAFLHVLQPLARLQGRLRLGLKPWRTRTLAGFTFPWPRASHLWREHWKAPDESLRSMEALFRQHRTVATRGGDYDRWDLEIRGGAFGTARIRMAVEEHGAGRQMLRFRCWPRVSPMALTSLVCLALLFAWALIDGNGITSRILGIATLLVAYGVFQECGAAMATFLLVLDSYKAREGK
ncbi:MAG: glycosyltransferase [Acidobacteria bacterium]|nr:glycosyltransferase [Acidobacteriota bacterium]